MKVKRMLTISELERFSRIQLTDIDPATWTYMEEIEVNQALPAAERMLDYLEKIKNPYCFLCGGIPIQICFVEKDVELVERLRAYLLSLKR